MDKYTYLKDLKNVFDSFSSGISVVDESGIVVTNNKTACGLLNLELDEIEDKIIFDILPEVWNDIIQILKTGLPQTGKETIIGDTKLIFDRSPIFIDNQIAFIINVFQEVPKYHKAHKEFGAINKLVEIIEKKRNESVDGFWVNDRYGKVVAVNRVSAKRSNIARNDAIGMIVEDFVNSGSVDKIVTREVINTKASVTCLQTLKDGKQLLSTGTPLFDHQGEIDLVVVSESEISDYSMFPQSFIEDRVLLHHPSPSVSNFPDEPNFYSNLVLQSKEIKDVFNTAMKVAAVDSSVLIKGESGTGKTFFAKIIHYGSERKMAPF